MDLCITHTSWHAHINLELFTRSNVMELLKRGKRYTKETNQIIYQIDEERQSNVVRGRSRNTGLSRWKN